MQLRSLTNVLADLDVVNLAFGSGGLITQTAADTYVERSIAASAVAGDEGISIVNGNGVSGNPTIGVDIQGTTALGVAVATGDSLLMFDTTAGTNLEVTVDQLKTFMNAGTSSTSITEGDSTLAIADSGTGTLTANFDGTDYWVSQASDTTFEHNVNFEVTTATTNADIPVITVSARSSGTPAAGIGPSIQFESETAAGAPGNLEIGGLFALEATDVTGASEDFDFVFQLMAGGTAATEVARITSTGNITLSGTVDGIDIATDVAANTAKVTNATHTGQVTGATALALDVTAVTAQPASGVIIATDTIIINDGGVLSEATFTQMNTYFDSSLSFGSGTVTSSGTPLNNEVAVFATATDINSDSTFTWDATTLIVNELSFAGDTISNNTTDQPIILRPNGTGSIIFQNGSSEEILELNDTVSAINGLAITAGATGVAPDISIGTGGEANIDIGFTTNGTGVLSVTAGSGNYEDNVTADDDLPNKKYVDDAIESLGGSGSLDTVTGTVDLTTASVQNIGAATGIPASCTIMSVMLEVDTASDAVTTVTVGDVTNGAASYMAATENDPEVLDIYVADGRVANAAATRQATATVATAGTVGAATCIITFRHN